MKNKLSAVSLSLIGSMLVMFLLFCITTLFNTKGEPREAIVAVSMLESGNWILPASFGGAEMPYKPPVLAWCIAIVSLIFGGEVTEFTSRVPSLVAAIFLVVQTARFFSKYGDRGYYAGWMAGWVTLTSFEVFRAATACRVDMLLTAFMVCAIYSLYSWFNDTGRHRIPWLAIILMSGAFLTKGPVGMALPCLIIWIYRLTQGDRFWKLTFRLICIGTASFIIPSLWYVEAYRSGGEQFLALVLEENIGRLTGTMSYESHVNPPSYNVLTLIAGMLPYTLLAIMSVFVMRWHGFVNKVKQRELFRGSISPASMLAIVASLTIFIFYCIPKSKRSVYLLPMYPFLAWGITLLMQWLTESRRGRRVIRIFSVFIGFLAVLLPLSWVIIKTGLCSGIRDLQNFNDFQSLGMSVVSGILAIFSVISGMWTIRFVRRKIFVRDAIGMRALTPMALSLFAVYSMLDNSILPPVLSAKSDISVTEKITEFQPEGEYLSWVEIPMLHFYTTNFYLNDRDRPIDPDNFDPKANIGRIILTNETDIESLTNKLGDKLNGLTLHELWKGDKRSCDTRRTPVILRIQSPPAKKE